MNNDKILDLEKKLRILQKEKKTLESENVKLESKEKRRLRANRLIKQGLLIDLAQLENIPKSILLGYLLEFKEKHKDNKYYLDNLDLKGKTKFLEKRLNEDGEKIDFK